MSVKRLALIAAVGSHHRTIYNTPTTTTTLSAVTQVLAATPATPTTFTRATTDDDNLNLNAAALGRGASAAADGGTRSRSSEEGINDDVSGGSGSGGGAAGAPVSSSEVGGGISTSHGFTSGFNYFTEHVAGGGGLYQGHQAMRPGATLHGNVNVLLGGAMLSVVITVVCVVCYCCHRNTKKRSESIYRQHRWSDNAGPNMEVYSVGQCYDASTLYSDSPQSNSCHISPTGHSGPPPSYDSVLAMDEFPSRPPPPPKYHQASRPLKPRCCTTARHVAFNHNTIVNHHHCRKYHQPQPPPSNNEAVRVRGPCSCLQRQMHELNNNRSHLSHSSRDHNKSVPSSADSLNNNNVSNNNSVTFEIDKPIYEGINSQLFGKPRNCSRASVQQHNTQLQQQLHMADVENGNISDSHVYSSVTEACFHPSQTNARLIDSGDATDEVANVNSSEAASDVVQMQATELELSSNLDQTTPRRQPPHENNQVQTHQPQREQQPPQQQQQQLGSHNLSALDTFNENGIIRMDMSQIIDTTGLPTYEAAIKLESSGYV